jgi:hypothetical protein
MTTTTAQSKDPQPPGQGFFVGRHGGAGQGQA